MDVKEPFKNFSSMITTVALYGQEEPVLFRGRLILREYFKEGSRKEIDHQKTADYALDTIYYETNKVIREQFHEPYGEPRELVVRHIEMLKDPYRIVYNKHAEPSDTRDNRLALLLDQDHSARGVAIILKENKDGFLESLEEAEARTIIRALSAMI